MSPLKKKTGKTKLGEKLGGMLNELIDGQATEERNREAIIQEMATEAGIEVATVNEILDGSINCPGTEVLEAFAKVLDSPVDDMYAAGNDDGCEYPAGEGEEGEEGGGESGEEGGEGAEPATEQRKGKKSPATIPQLKDQFPNEPAFVLAQAEKRATLQEATANFAHILQQRNEVLKKDNKRLRGDGSPGAEPLTTETPDDPRAAGGDFMDVSREYAKEKKITLTQAMSYTARTQPKLHRKYVEKQAARAPEISDRKKQAGMH